MLFQSKPLSDAFDVLSLFVIPIGGGIPAGVILAKARSLPWYFTAFIYFVSDVLLACAFEPCIYLFLKLSKNSAFLQRFTAAYKESLAKTGFKYGLTPTPFSLIILSLGVDPMTGRSAAKAAGHGFISGWSLAICGDMIFFAIIMASTLLLNNILGDGTWAAVIVMIGMIGIPMLVRKFKSSRTAARGL